MYFFWCLHIELLWKKILLAKSKKKNAEKHKARSMRCQQSKYDTHCFEKPKGNSRRMTEETSADAMDGIQTPSYSSHWGEARVFVICLNMCSICQPQIPRQIHNPEWHQNVTRRCQEACFHLQIFHINKFSNSFILSSLSALLDVTHSCHKCSDTSSTTPDKRYSLRRSAHQNVLGEQQRFYALSSDQFKALRIQAK